MPQLSTAPPEITGLVDARLATLTKRRATAQRLRHFTGRSRAIHRVLPT